MSTEILNALKVRMEGEVDIKRVVRLVPCGDRFRYLIETPFQTFPKFVIGTTDAAFDDVRREFRCFILDNAERHWADQSVEA